ncbi:hypothetical protein ACERK3_04750 [Phycisphaerales bacterium AB-hyl4]|uniref:DUF2892 family protein n=1 Tax=Natronomicrosphaera hydrolytica TaxID=3242702 RepID=A0ABV4U1W9_9BACT
MNLPPSAHRVPQNTPDDLNQRIRHTTQANIDYYAHHPDQIDDRLSELDEEWDIERVLETNAATLALTATIFGLLFGRRWLILAALVTGFLLQHGLQGWCPPIRLFRRLGFRTPREIEAERYALKAVRGDFKDVPQGMEGAEPAMRATGRLGA